MPPYVTPEDEARERTVANAIEQAYDCLLLKLGRKGKADMIGVRAGKVVAVFEIKNRRTRSDEFPTLWVETAKVRQLLTASEFFDVPAFFVARWEDGEIRMVDARDVAGLSAPSVTVDRTRNPRGDALDRDEVYLLPIHAMRLVA